MPTIRVSILLQYRDVRRNYVESEKSKPILICAISLALCAMGSLTAVAVNHIGNDQNQSATVIAANEVCAMDNVQEVEDEGDMMFETYERKEAELNGECSTDADRVTVEEVEEMIHNGMDYSMIESKLAEIHPFADLQAVVVSR